MTNQIFADTAFFLALINKRDQYHQEANRVGKAVKGRPWLTTSGVLLEVGNTLSRTHKHEAADTIDQVLTSSDVEVVHLTPQLLNQALSLYRSHADKIWGLVDCISFVVMQEHGVTEALTSDRHFGQAGFAVLMQADRPIH